MVGKQVKEFWDYDQNKIPAKQCSMHGVRQFDYSDYEEVAYSKEEVMAFAQAYYEWRMNKDSLTDFHKWLIREL